MAWRGKSRDSARTAQIVMHNRFKLTIQIRNARTCIYTHLHVSTHICTHLHTHKHTHTHTHTLLKISDPSHGVAVCGSELLLGIMTGVWDGFKCHPTISQARPQVHWSAAISPTLMKVHLLFLTFGPQCIKNNILHTKNTGGDYCIMITDTFVLYLQHTLSLMLSQVFRLLTEKKMACVIIGSEGGGRCLSTHEQASSVNTQVRVSFHSFSYIYSVNASKTVNQSTILRLIY